MSLRVWLPLNGDLRNQGISNLNLNTSATFITPGKIGQQCLNSQVGWFTVPEMDNKKQMSFAYWVKINEGTTTNWLDTFSWYSTDGTTASRSRQEFYYYNTNGNTEGMTTGVWYYNSSNSGFTQRNIGQWYHYAFTIDYSAGISKFYIDGVLAKTTINVNTDHYIRPGNYQFLLRESALNASINDFRLYDHILSAAEVKEIAQGLVLHYKLDGFFGGAGENLVINGDVRNDLTSWSNWGTATNRQVVTIGTKKWLNFKTDPNGNYGGFSQDRGIALYKPNTQYTISALMYASANASGRLWVHTRSTEGGANLAQYLTTVNVTTSPALYTFTFNTGSNASYTINKLNLMIGAVNTTSALNFYITNIKVEEGTKATTWVPCKEEGGYDITKVEDSSGYNHNGILNDTNAQFITTTRRYSACIKNSQATNSATYLMQGECNIPESNALTFSWWMNPTSLGLQTSGIFSTSNGIATDYQTTAANMRDSCFDCCNTNGTCVRINVANYITLNEWHHYALTYNGSQLNFYKDGESKVTASQTGALKAFQYIYPFYSKAGGLSRCTSGSLSDFRIYVTQLLDNDIKSLYNISMKVDNKNNIHVFELQENDNTQKIKKTGILSTARLNEKYNFGSKFHKQTRPNILPGLLHIKTTKNGHEVLINTLQSVPSTIMQSLAGKALTLSMDICAPGARYSTENNQTAWSQIRYGVHGSMTSQNSSGTTVTDYPFTGNFQYSGEAQRWYQSWTVPSNYNTYGNFTITVQNFDKPASTNDALWFFKNIKLEVGSYPTPYVEYNKLNDTIIGGTTCSQIIER